MDEEFASITEENLEDWLSGNELCEDEKLYIVLATCQSVTRSSTSVVLWGRQHGWHWFDASAIHQRLSQFPELAIQKGAGWKLTSKGKAFVRTTIAKVHKKPIVEAVSQLRDILPTITNPKVKDFVEEAIRDIEISSFRSAVILSWCGAVGLLQEHVVKTDLAGFNVEARKVKQNWKDAGNEADVRKMQEGDFLVVACNTGLFDKNVKQVLERALELRNGCGHPSQLVPGPSRVESHVEELVTYVFSKFG